ncbi:hypothetical protein [Streptomyces sp. CA-111067]|uniref:hypothetical protein n=1 Tax=Streptomyces sp. CA-111067 TaxID=3240046 RepID=UPI003D967CA5
MNGTGYRKITEPDTKGTWGRPGADEVDYLLQSEKAEWPNYVHAQVLAPGVPSMVERDHTWYLFFAGYATSEKPTGKKGTFDPSHRQPYYVPLHVDIPHGTAVANATSTQLKSWITVQM